MKQADAYLMDSLETSMCWEFKNGRGEGFDGSQDRRFYWIVPLFPASTRETFGAKSLLAVTIEADGQPAGRVILINPKRRFAAADLRWFEAIVRHIGPPLENVFLLRSLRSRAIESERSRISRDLHDGILQTLLSLNIQLGVLRIKAEQKPEELAEDMTGLQKTVREEGEELRRMVTDMRPLRVDSADMRELMLGFAERYRNESGLKLDLFINDQNMRVPDRLCRELFPDIQGSTSQHKKHEGLAIAGKTRARRHTRVFLVIDDNGTGFSFSGHYK